MHKTKAAEKKARRGEGTDDDATDEENERLSGRSTVAQDEKQEDLFRTGSSGLACLRLIFTHDLP